MRFYTNRMLMEYTYTIPELYIHSNEEFRLLLELRRLTKEYEVQVETKRGEKNPFVYVECGDGRIFIKEDFIYAEKSGRHITYSVKEFIHNPAGKMKEIKGWIDRDI